jgi:hypothetical protein
LASSLAHLLGTDPRTEIRESLARFARDWNTRTL